MIYNLSNQKGKDSFKEKCEVLLEGDKRVELKVLSDTRTSRQNRALHLFFNQVAKELNDLGIPFVYMGLKGHEMEMQWTGELFKQMTWKPIQKALFGTESTTKLSKTKQIDQIFEVINKFFAERGIEVSFPNQFDVYLKFYENEKIN